MDLILQYAPTVMGAMPVAVTRCSADLRYLWVSQRYAEWVDLPVEKIIGRSIAEVLGDDGLRSIRPYIHRVLSGEHIQYEAQLLLKKGPRWVRGEYTPTFDATGKPDGWVAVVTDITAQREAQVALAQSEERFRLLHRLASGNVATLTDNELLQKVLEAALEATGADKGNVQIYDEQKKALYIAVHHGFQDPFLEFFRTVEDDEPTACGESVRSRGRVIVEDVACSPIFAGQPTLKFLEAEGVRAVQSTPIVSRQGHLLGVFSTHWLKPHRPDPSTLLTLDLLARDAAQILEHRRSERALRESEEQFRTLANTMPLLAWYANPDGFIPWYNQRWHEYTGMSLEAQEGWKWTSVHDPADVERVKAKWKAALESGQPWEDQFRLRRHDGQFRWFLSRAIPMRDAEGRIVRWFGTNVDIEDQKRAEAEAEAASRGKDEFLAMLGHELRNPLSPILTALHLLRLRGGSAIERECTIIERQANHLVRLVDDLLDTARITRGKIALKKAHVDLAEVVAKAIELSSPLIEQQRHQLSIDVARGLVVDADADRLSQVVSNLLTNAAKYTQPGGHIWIVAKQGGRQAVVSVRDNGIGISPDMLPKIFESFVQSRQSIDRAQGGLGLGLAIVKNLVHAHGGQVEVHSEGLGKGSEFVIRLPLAVTARLALVQDKGMPRDPTLIARMRVLVVDDNQDAADLLAEALRSMGHEVAVAHDGPRALEVAEAFVPEIALLDIGLPAMDGYELASRLRQLPRLRNVRLVAVTGYGQESDRRRAREAGISIHLVKPVEVAKVEAVINDLAKTIAVEV